MLYEVITKYGLDPQEDVLKSGKRPPSPDWGNEPVPATLTVWQDGVAASRITSYNVCYTKLLRISTRLPTTRASWGR